jgi:hypothetical protein
VVLLRTDLKTLSPEEPVSTRTLLTVWQLPPELSQMVTSVQGLLMAELQTVGLLSPAVPR